MTDHRLTRRAALLGLAAGPAVLTGRSTAEVPAERVPTAAEAEAQAIAAHQNLAAMPGLQMAGNEQIAILVYPGMTALDVVGPHYFLASLLGASVHMVTTGADLAPVESDLGLAIAPTVTLRDCPTGLDLLLLPGGTDGMLAVGQDGAALGFLRDRAVDTRLLASVCTGSWLWGLAGQLSGRRATSHWVLRDHLTAFGATPVDARLVEDGNLWTAAGVSAGLDLGIALTAALRGRPYAEAMMLQAEYAPAPPFPGGTPATTPEPVAQAMSDMYAPFAVAALALAGG